MDKEYIADLFMRGQDCGQVVLSHYADELGMEEAALNQLTACYGGGCGIGETCGAVLGALAVVGIKAGHQGPDDMEQRTLMMTKRSEFITLWKEKRHSCMCRELLGYDVSDPEELAIILEKGLMFDLCPELVMDAVSILDGLSYEPVEESMSETADESFAFQAQL